MVIGLVLVLSVLTVINISSLVRADGGTDKSDPAQVLRGIRPSVAGVGLPLIYDWNDPGNPWSFALNLFTDGDNFGIGTFSPEIDLTVRDGSIYIGATTEANSGALWFKTAHQGSSSGDHHMFIKNDVDASDEERLCVYHQNIPPTDVPTEDGRAFCVAWHGGIGIGAIAASDDALNSGGIEADGLISTASSVAAGLDLIAGDDVIAADDVIVRDDVIATGNVSGFDIMASDDIISDGSIFKTIGGSTRFWVTQTADGAAYMETRGPNGNDNFRVTHLSSNGNHGYVTVLDSAGLSQAGMYVDSSGNGLVFGDTKSFRVTNAADSATDIWYTSLEGPEAGAYLRGTARLQNGSATITFPDHFLQVASSDGMTVQVTPLSTASNGLAVTHKGLDGVVVEDLGETGDYEFDYTVNVVRKGHEDYQVIRPALSVMPQGAEPVPDEPPVAPTASDAASDNETAPTHRPQQ